MNKLDFNILAGWPGSTETFQFLQNMILQAQSCSLIGGKNFILSGCTESMGNVANGIVCINGEILPFVGGPMQPNVIISDDVVSREFFGGASNPYYHFRAATFGTGTEVFVWEEFRRNDPDNGVLARLDRVEKMLRPLMGYTVGETTQYGSWLFWGRPASEIPPGWEPVPDEDWKGRVPVVLNTGEAEFNTVGKVGGLKTHKLTISEMPIHGHRVRGDNAGDSGGIPFSLNKNGVALTGASRSNGYLLKNGDGNNLVEVAGGDAAHNNLQPYKVVMFIRFIG